MRQVGYSPDFVVRAMEHFLGHAIQSVGHSLNSAIRPGPACGRFDCCECFFQCLFPVVSKELTWFDSFSEVRAAEAGRVMVARC